jgi:hypothetical protein
LATRGEPASGPAVVTDGGRHGVTEKEKKKRKRKSA